MPLSLKRQLGARVMDGISNNASTITLPDGRVFKVIEDRLFLRVFYDGDYEPQLSQIVMQLLRSGDTAVDVGANFGWYTTLFSKIIQNGMIISYEPVPRTFNILRENVQLNKLESYVDIRRLCVGDKNGFVSLNVDSNSNSGLAHVDPGDDSETEKVPMVRLSDDLFLHIGNIAFIKMDVEGYELAALRGAKALLEVKNQPILQIELNNDALSRAGTDRLSVLNYLKEHNYIFWEVNHYGELVRSKGDKCSDIFCSGSGIFSKRVELLTNSNKSNPT